MNPFKILRKSKSRLEDYAKSTVETEAFKSTRRATEEAATRAKEAIKSIDKEDVERVAKRASIAWLKFDKDAKMALLLGFVALCVAFYLPLGAKLPPMIGVAIGGWYFISAKISRAGKS